MTSAEPGAVRHPARALVAWMEERARGRLDRGDAPAPLPDFGPALRDRPPLDQAGLITPVSDVLREHVAAVRASEGARRMLAEGWEIALVSDLRRVIAAQPLVVCDRAPGEPADPPAGDPVAIARVTLPLAPPPADISYELNEPDQTWEIRSPNPNLRINGTFGGELGPGVSGFGFTFSVMTSYLSIAERDGRHVLRDGYHRAYRLLAAGIHQVPAFVRRYGEREAIFRSSMLGEGTYLSDRAPTLADYHDDAVAGDAWITLGETRARVSAVPASLAVGTIA